MVKKWVRYPGVWSKQQECGLRRCWGARVWDKERAGMQVSRVSAAPIIHERPSPPQVWADLAVTQQTIIPAHWMLARLQLGPRCRPSKDTNTHIQSRLLIGHHEITKGLWLVDWPGSQVLWPPMCGSSGGGRALTRSAGDNTDLLLANPTQIKASDWPITASHWPNLLTPSQTGITKNQKSEICVTGNPIWALHEWRYLTEMFQGSGCVIIAHRRCGWMRLLLWLSDVRSQQALSAPG